MMITAVYVERFGVMSLEQKEESHLHKTPLGIFYVSFVVNAFFLFVSFFFVLSFIFSWRLLLSFFFFFFNFGP